MNQKKSKWIANLVKNKDINLFMTVRNNCGKKTETMSSRGLYRVAKKLWKLKVEGVEKWGRRVLSNGKSS